MLKPFFQFLKTWKSMLLIALLSSALVAFVSWYFKLSFAANEFVNTLFRSFVAVALAQLAGYRLDIITQKRLKKQLIFLANQVKQNLEPALGNKVTPIEAAKQRSELVNDALKKDVADMRQMGLTLNASNAIPEEVLESLDELYRKVINQKDIYECAKCLQFILEHLKY